MDILESLYESILITEMDEKVIRYIENNKDELLPFDNIFGDNLRVVIPMMGSEVLSDLMRDIRSVDGFLGFDKNTQEVVRSVKLDPKYGKGDKREQRIKLGKAIQGLKISDDVKKKYLNWYAKYKDSLSNMDILDQYAIVLSRAPIDIVRMSDHRNITSCHSRGGSHFKCAIEEAINGGGVAYLIYKDSLSNLSDTELQNDDIFSDNDRGIRGVEPPLARLRLRNIKSAYNGTEFAMPELRVYGNDKIPGFYQSVVNFLKTKQTIDPKKFQEQKHNIIGGTYEDNEVSDLINSYFDLKDDEEYSKYDLDISTTGDAEDREQTHLKLGEDLANDLQEISDNYQYDEDITVWFHVDNDEEDYYLMSAEINFDLSRYNIIEDFQITISDNYDVRKAFEDETYGQFINQLYGIIKNYDVYINIIEADEETLKLVVYYDTYGESRIDPYDFDTFCNNLKNIDRNWQGIESDIEEALIDSELITGGSQEYSRIKEYIETEELPWKNIDIIGSNFRDYEVILVKSSNFGNRTIPIIKLDSNTISNIHMSIFDSSFIRKVENALWNFSIENFKPKMENDDSQMKFTSFFESYVNEDWTKDVAFKNFIIRIDQNSELNYTYPNTVLLKTFNITPNNWSNITMQYFDFIDNDYNLIINLVRYVTINQLLYSHQDNIEIVNSIKKSAPNYSNLDRVFKKYLN
jgi:hypothetical protein